MDAASNLYSNLDKSLFVLELCSARNSLSVVSGFNNSVLSPCVRKDNSKGLVQTVPMLQLSPRSSTTNLWFNLENVNGNSVLFFLLLDMCLSVEIWMSCRGFLVTGERLGRAAQRDSGVPLFSDI